MRAWRRSLVLALIAAAALGACQRNPDASSGESGPEAPSNADREKGIAAAQFRELGGPASAAQKALLEGEFEASGGVDPSGSGEGGWNLTLSDDYAVFSRPGLDPDYGFPGARDYREHGLRVVAPPLTITIKQETCSASGVELPYVAHVLYEGVPYQGCARRGVAAGAPQTWASSVLPDLIPGIDACLARLNGRAARITFATLLEEGDVSVRIRENDGTRRVCSVTASGANARLEHLSDSDTVRGESDPEFQRGGAEPRRRNCPAAEQAIGSGGEALGWLIRRSGC